MEDFDQVALGIGLAIVGGAAVFAGWRDSQVRMYYDVTKEIVEKKTQVRKEYRR